MLVRSRWGALRASQTRRAAPAGSGHSTNPALLRLTNSKPLLPSECALAQTRGLIAKWRHHAPCEEQVCLCNNSANIETLPASRHICVEKNTHTSTKSRHINTSHPCTLSRRAPPLPTHLHHPNTTRPQVTTAHRTLQQSCCCCCRHRSRRRRFGLFKGYSNTVTASHSCGSREHAIAHTKSSAADTAVSIRCAAMRFTSSASTSSICRGISNRTCGGFGCEAWGTRSPGIHVVATEAGGR